MHELLPAAVSVRYAVLRNIGIYKMDEFLKNIPLIGYEACAKKFLTIYI